MAWICAVLLLGGLAIARADEDATNSLAVDETVSVPVEPPSLPVVLLLLNTFGNGSAPGESRRNSSGITGSRAILVFTTLLANSTENADTKRDGVKPVKRMTEESGARARRAAEEEPLIRVKRTFSKKKCGKICHMMMSMIPAMPQGCNGGCNHPPPPCQTCHQPVYQPPPPPPPQQQHCDQCSQLQPRPQPVYHPPQPSPCGGGGCGRPQPQYHPQPSPCGGGGCGQPQPQYHPQPSPCGGGGGCGGGGYPMMSGSYSQSSAQSSSSSWGMGGKKK